MAKVDGLAYALYRIESSKQETLTPALYSDPTTYLEKTMTVARLTLSEAATIAAGALAKARQEGMSPMAVAVVDEACALAGIEAPDLAAKL